MSERETVKEEVARLREALHDLEWEQAQAGPAITGQVPVKRLASSISMNMLRNRIDYLTREYIARGIIYEPEH